MVHSVETTTRSGAYPVSLEAVRRFLRVDSTDEDGDIYELITEVSDELERDTASYVRQATVVERWDHFPAFPVSLARFPLQSVTSFEYLDTDGNTQTWASTNYEVDTKSVPARITLAEGGTLPTVQTDTIQTAILTYVAGYTAATLPPTVKRALRSRILRLWMRCELDENDDRVWQYAKRHLLWRL